MPSVSILIPVYNAANYIAATVESVLAQTYTDWELIILDDASTDKSYELAQSFAKEDARIKVYKNEQNLGMMRNWNKGLSLCRNEFFAKLDADDLWHPQMLEASIKILLDKSEIGMICTRYVNIDAQGKIVDQSIAEIPDFAKNSAFSCVGLVKMGAGQMLQYNILRQGVSLVRRSIFDELGVYRTLLTSKTEASVDTEMYFRIGCHYLIYSIDKVYYYYRVHDKSISAQDKVENLNALKLYEVKTVIINYYYTQGKINKAIKNRSLADTQFLYNSFLIYQARVKKDYLKMSKNLLLNACIDLKRTLIENIHIERLLPI